MTPKVKYKKNGDWNELDLSSGGSGSNVSIDDTNTSVDKTWSSDKINKQFQTIANEDLVIGEDGKLYIKQADGTEKGTGVEIPTGTAEVPDNVVLWEDDGTIDEEETTGYTLPIATSTTLGGVKPVKKTTEMTQEVGVDSEGKLYTSPSSSSSGGTTSSAINEVIANDELVNTTIQNGQTAQSIFSTEITWEQLKQYKRFAIIFKGESNTGANNTYIQIGNTKIARFGDGGFYGEYNFLGENLLECHSMSGNPSTVQLSPFDTVNMAYTGKLQRGMTLGNMSSVSDTDVLNIYFSSDTTINYTLKVIGMTKEE